MELLSVTRIEQDEEFERAGPVALLETERQQLVSIERGSTRAVSCLRLEYLVFVLVVVGDLEL